MAWQPCPKSFETAFAHASPFLEITGDMVLRLDAPVARLYRCPKAEFGHARQEERPGFLQWDHYLRPVFYGHGPARYPGKDEFDPGTFRCCSGYGGQGIWIIPGDKNIKKVLILGAGTMGLQIGIQCAASGFEVMVYDPFDAALEAAQKRLDGLAGKLASANRITAEQAQMALIRMQFSSDPEIAGKDADFISESVPEDPKLKARVFAQFNKICPAHTIFTTNTSTLDPFNDRGGHRKAGPVCRLSLPRLHADQCGGYHAPSRHIRRHP